MKLHSMDKQTLQQDIADKMQVVAQAYQEFINAERWYKDQVKQLETLQAELSKLNEE